MAADMYSIPLVLIIIGDNIIVVGDINNILRSTILYRVRRSYIDIGGVTYTSSGNSSSVVLVASALYCLSLKTTV